MFVGKPQINYICLKKKKRKKPADIMLNKAYLKSCCLSPCMKRKCHQKTLTWTSVLSSPSGPSAAILVNVW